MHEAAAEEIPNLLLLLFVFRHPFPLIIPPNSNAAA